ncbi:ATP-binding protein [Flavobacteriaceae bacterium MHTCC 0001]
MLSCSLHAQKGKYIKKQKVLFEELVHQNFNAAKRNAQQTLLEGETVSNDTLLLEACTNLSEIYYLLRVLDSSSFYCDKALKYAIKLKDYNKQALIYSRKGRLADRAKDFNKALLFNETALSISKKYNLGYLEAGIYKNSALLYLSKLENKKSLEIIDVAIEKALEYKNEVELAESYNAKGVLLFNSQKDSVLHFYNESLKIAKRNSSFYIQGAVLSNIGEYYANKGDTANAMLYLNQAEAFSKVVGNRKSLYHIAFSKAFCFENDENYVEAIKGYKNLLIDYTDIITKFQRSRIYWLLSGVLWSNDEFEEAFDIQEKYIYLNDSIFDIEKEKEFQALRTQYEVEKKDNQITLLETENELAATRRKWIIVTGVLLTLPLLTLFLFYRHRAKTQHTIRVQEQQLHKQEKAHLQQQQHIKATQALIEGQDKERERIAKELHDGIGGQLASINLSLSHINTAGNDTSITAISKSLKSTFKELRNLSHDLSYSYHQDKSFGLLLTELKQKYEDNAPFAFHITIYPEHALQHIDVYVKHNLYRILQELLTNVVKHAEADTVQLSFNKHDDRLVMLFEDNGLGMSYDEHYEGIGLKNIKQRVASIDATVVIDTAPGKGTSIIIEVPIGRM